MQILHQPSEVVVEIGDHAEKRGFLVVDLAAKRRLEIRGGCQRRVRRVRSEIAEERWGPLPCPRRTGAFINKRHRLIKEDVLPVALPFRPLAVADDNRIEVNLRAADVPRAPIKPTLPGRILAVIAQVPFADESGAIAGGFQELRQDDGVLVQMLSWLAGVRDPISELMHTRHERRASRRARRTHVELLEAHALIVQRIQVRRLEQWVPMSPHIAVALIVSQDEDDVRFLGGNRIGCVQRGQRR
jgi:hypothetical protein